MTNDLKERVADELVPEIMALLKEEHNHVLDLVENEVKNLKINTYDFGENYDYALKDILTIINQLRV